MEDIVQIRLMFVAGVLAIGGVTALLSYAIGELQSRLAARDGRSTITARRRVKDTPLRGTR